jgi:hypothetical protein
MERAAWIVTTDARRVMPAHVTAVTAVLAHVKPRDESRLLVAMTRAENVLKSGGDTNVDTALHNRCLRVEGLESMETPPPRQWKCRFAELKPDNADAMRAKGVFSAQDVLQWVNQLRA